MSERFRRAIPPPSRGSSPASSARPPSSASVSATGERRRFSRGRTPRVSYRIGVDIGGTFADFCALDEATGRLATLKVLSTPQEPGREVIAGLAELGSRFGIQPQDIGYFTHGTTVGINSVIQRKGIRLCLFTTENFVDVLEVARLKMPDPYHLMSRRAEPLITRDRVLPVRQRILADGTVETPLDHASLRRALDQAIALGAQGIVLALLRSEEHTSELQSPVHLVCR